MKPQPGNDHDAAEGKKSTIVSKKEGEDPLILQDWASHIRYPKTLIDRHPRPTVDTGLFKNATQIRYE